MAVALIQAPRVAVPGDPIVTDFVPQRLVLGRAALAITHAASTPYSMRFPLECR
jgi:UDP:flavonoid glycosyltransferase YjiC (YdhE family)